MPKYDRGRQCAANSRRRARQKAFENFISEIQLALRGGVACASRLQAMYSRHGTAVGLAYGPEEGERRSDATIAEHGDAKQVFASPYTASGGSWMEGGPRSARCGELVRPIEVRRPVVVAVVDCSGREAERGGHGERDLELGGHHGGGGGA